MIKCFCDASYSPQTKIAIVGWQIGNSDITTIKIENTNNTRAEIIGIIKLMTEIHDIHNTDNANKPKKEYTIYTDCQSILNRIESKDKLIKKNFMNRKNVRLANADLYEQLFDLLQNNIILEHIVGHMPNKKMNEQNKQFSILDRLVRSELRKIT